jgi:hypothetical protein
MKSLLFLLVSFVAITALLCGLLIIGDPDGGLMNLSPALLENTPFKNFLVPGIILTVVVGGVSMVALARNIQDHPKRYRWSIAAGVIMIGWIVVETLMIQHFTWMQAVYLSAGILIVLLASRLNKIRFI